MFQEKEGSLTLIPHTLRPLCYVMFFQCENKSFISIQFSRKNIVPVYFINDVNRFCFTKPKVDTFLMNWFTFVTFLYIIYLFVLRYVHLCLMNIKDIHILLRQHVKNFDILVCKKIDSTHENEQRLIVFIICKKVSQRHHKSSKTLLLIICQGECVLVEGLFEISPDSLGMLYIFYYVN